MVFEKKIVKKLSLYILFFTFAQGSPGSKYIYNSFKSTLSSRVISQINFLWPLYKYLISYDNYAYSRFSKIKMITIGTL